MSRQRFGLLLVAALIALGCALYISTRRSLPRETHGAPFLPGLGAELNSVTAVVLRKSDATLTLHKVDDRWSVAERADYPADLAKLRKLLVSLRDATIIEEKTSDPARFAAIGVEDPAPATAPAAVPIAVPGGTAAAGAAVPGASAVEITVVSPSGKHAVILGKPIGTGNFVRRTGEQRSFSVEPAITVETEPRLWIDPHVLDVAVKQIQRVEVKPAAGATYALRRVKPDEEDFALDGVPAGRKALDGHALAPSSSAFSNLTAEDVAASSGIDFAQGSRASVTLTDGTVLTLMGMTAADKHWLEVQSSKDAALTAKASGRAYEIPGYRYDAVFRPLEQLLVPKESPVVKSPKNAAGQGAAGPSADHRAAAKRPLPTAP